MFKQTATTGVALADLHHEASDPLAPIREHAGEERCEFSFSLTWDILGPFQIGTREATWGADPLEYLGGFRSLRHDPKSRYNSSLASEGMVSWSSQQANLSVSNSDAAVADLTVSFPGVDWEFLRSIYGWAAIQYQAWARGSLVVDAEASQTVILYTDNVLEFWIDDQLHFGGDIYAYRKAPLVLRLDPGSHKIDVRLLRDVRAMGGVGDPNIRVKIEAQKSKGGLAAVDSLLLPDIVEGNLPSRFGSVTVRNEEQAWVEISDIKSVDVCKHPEIVHYTTLIPSKETFALTMTETTPFRLAPGQTRPLVFHVSMLKIKPFSLSLEILFTLNGSSSLLSSTIVPHRFSYRTVRQPHKFTFVLPSGTLSYCILRAPSRNVTNESSPNQSLPVLLNLHGAGLEADSHQVRHMLDALPDLRAWVLFPTGVTPWSGDDWHTLGFSDVEAGVSAISDWIKTVGWKGPSVDTEKWLVSGHSNGGQGTWHALTHHPDRILGGAPVSGYSSIQAYVPYTNWNVSDPRITALVQGSLSDYRHELLVENFSGIPVMQQHGSADDNVPVYHSRMMRQLISQADWSSNYSELRGKGHWFDTVMTTTTLRKFYEQTLSGEQVKPSLPHRFTLSVANPASMSSRGGIIVDQLISPNQLGRIRIERDRARTAWSIKTSNVRRFHFSPQSFKGTMPHLEVIVDGCPITLLSVPRHAEQWFIWNVDGSWQLSRDARWKSLEQRFGRQLGTLDSILRTRGKLFVCSSNAGTLRVCLQITRNLFQYFRADAEIIESKTIQSEAGNLISVERGPVIPTALLPSFPVSIEQGEGVWIRDARGRRRLYEFEEGLGAIYISPLPNERLELKIWGFDERGLDQAARLLPMLTGVGQPDFVIVGKRCAWEGAAGVYALGSFDSFWNISDVSFLL